MSKYIQKTSERGFIPPRDIHEALKRYEEVYQNMAAKNVEIISQQVKPGDVFSPRAVEENKMVVVRK